MADGPREEGRLRRALKVTDPVPVCRRLQLVTVLLGIVGVLGLVTAAMVAISPEGEGLGDILPADDVEVIGQVRDAEGTLVPDARVSCEDDGVSNVTGASGWYFLEGVGTGDVKLKMEADGYKTVVKTVHLERGTYTVDFLAEPGAGTVQVPGLVVPEAGDPGAITWLMALGIGVAATFALLGAAGAYLRRWYPLVIVGSLLGILTWGWFVGSAVSLISLIIAMPLREQFGLKAIECEPPWHDEPPPDLDMPEEPDTASEDHQAINVSAVHDGGDAPGGSGGMPPG